MLSPPPRLRWGKIRTGSLGTSRVAVFPLPYRGCRTSRAGMVRRLPWIRGSCAPGWSIPSRRFVSYCRKSGQDFCKRCSQQPKWLPRLSWLLSARSLRKFRYKNRIQHHKYCTQKRTSHQVLLSWSARSLHKMSRRGSIQRHRCTQKRKSPQVLLSCHFRSLHNPDHKRCKSQLDRYPTNMKTPPKN